MSVSLVFSFITGLPDEMPDEVPVDEIVQTGIDIHRLTLKKLPNVTGKSLVVLSGHYAHLPIVLLCAFTINSHLLLWIASFALFHM